MLPFFQSIFPEPGTSSSANLRAELAKCKRDLAHARGQLIQAWFGARTIENAPMDNSIDPMQLVVTDEVLPEDSDQEA